MLYRRILVPVDGSRHANRALDHAAELAREQHAKLTILVVLPPFSAAEGLAASQSAMSRLDVYEGILRNARERVGEDIGVEAQLAEGIPAAEIVRRAGDFDLVVMGTHGRGRIGDALLGSVSREVLHRVDVPVLLLRGSKDAADGA